MKRFFNIVILILIAYQVSSQNINYGVGAGANYSNIIANQSFIDFYNYKVGFQINSIFEFNFSNKLGLRLEPGFATRGSDEKNNNLKTKININYITVPFLLKYTPLNKVSLYVGPESSFRLTKDFDKTNYFTKQFIDKKFDFGINMGVSYSLIDRFNINFRFNRGIISVFNNELKFVDEKGAPFGDIKMYNQGFSVFLTYMIN